MPDPAAVEFTSLVEQPADFDGKPVAVRGYLTIGPGVQVLTQNRLRRRDKVDAPECLPLTGVPQHVLDMSPFSGFVKLEGVFRVGIRLPYPAPAACGDNGIEVGAVTFEPKQ